MLIAIIISISWILCIPLILLNNWIMTKFSPFNDLFGPAESPGELKFLIKASLFFSPFILTFQLVYILISLINSGPLSLVDKIVNRWFQTKPIPEPLQLPNPPYRQSAIEHSKVVSEECKCRVSTLYKGTYGDI